MAGYSGTPLAKKLGIKPGATVMVMDAPTNYQQLLAPLPDAVKFTRSMSAAVDIVHLFAKSRSKLASRLTNVIEKLRPDSAIWVSWPKKASKVETDITEDVICKIALPMGLVDIKVCAVDETWSGLKLVIRKELRKKTR